MVRVQLSNGSIIRSKLNRQVPAIGYVAGPPLSSAESYEGRVTVVVSGAELEEIKRQDSIPCDEELAVLQIFAEFKDHHNADDVAKRFSISRHKAEYYLDRLREAHLIGHLDEYRNGKAVFFITHRGRDLLVKKGRL